VLFASLIQYIVQYSKIYCASLACRFGRVGNGTTAMTLVARLTALDTFGQADSVGISDMVRPRVVTRLTVM